MMNVVTRYAQKISAMEIMTDDQIRQNIMAQLQRMERPIGSLVLTWEQVSTEYVLEIVLLGEKRDICGCSEAGEKINYRLRIGQINIHAFDAFNKLSLTGRRLYFRLRKDFPMLKRKLSVYKYNRANKSRPL